jgi:hypothetical protein
MLNCETVQATLQALEAALAHDECRNCECLQGFVTQLSLDADEDAAALIRPWLAPRGQAHNCLGCEPCPSGDQFAAYLRNPSNSRQQPIVLT